MMQNTTPEEQGMGAGDAHMKERPNNKANLIWTRDEVTGEEWTTVEGGEEILADNTQGDHSTVSTECTHDKRIFISHPSSTPDAETDPTSIPSGILDDLDLERKCTESPLNSIDAVHGSDSCHSAQSDLSTDDGDSREGIPIAVNPGKVEAIGDHFGESGTEPSTPRFHDPRTSWEADHINDKIKNMHDTMDDIDRHPEECFRDPGCSYQVSARPKGSAEPALDMESDVTHKRKVHFLPDPVLQVDIEEGQSTERPKRGKSPCCIIM